MAISDEMWLIALGIAFIHIVIYKKNKLFGNLSYMGMGLGTMSFNTDPIFGITGIIILIGGFISLIYDIALKLGTENIGRKLK